MSQEADIFVICGDPGGASAVAPVVTALLGRGLYIRALLYGAGPVIWRRQALPFEELDRSAVPVDVASILGSARAKLLLAGSSMNQENLEKEFILAARQLGVPSLVVLDFWSNYAARFSGAAGQLSYVPDRIAVMDERARDEMIAAGLPPSRLVITGQPAFDCLAEYRRDGVERRAMVRRTLGIRPEERLVLFASQPIASVLGTGPESRLYPGYTERTVLDLLVPALERIAVRRDQAVTLLIRPHPREAAATLNHWRSEHIRVVVSGDGDGREVALAADLVTGMSTILLMEACLMGCLVVSLQPGLRLADPLPTNQSGLSRAVYNAGEIEPVIDQMLIDAAAQAEMRTRLKAVQPPACATERVVALIESMIGARDRPLASEVEA